MVLLLWYDSDAMTNLGSHEHAHFVSLGLHITAEGQLDHDGDHLVDEPVGHQGDTVVRQQGPHQGQRDQ